MTDHEFIEKLLDVPEENQTIEFKRIGSKGDIEKILETIVALTNTDGGHIVIGISDPEKGGKKYSERVFGIQENKDAFDAIGREIQKLVPPLSGIWPAALLEDRDTNLTVAIITVPKAQDHFRSFNNHVFLRQQKSNILLTPQEIITYAYAKGFQRADNELVDVDFRLLDTPFYQAWKEKRGVVGVTIQDVLEKTGLAKKNDQGIMQPTRAAVLSFAEYPTNLMDTKCAIRIFQYEGKTESFGKVPNLVSAPETIHGPAVKLIADAQARVLTLLRSGIAMPASGFVTKYQLPERAVKEAITNAVIHRDYHAKRDIEIKIFEDRIEIESPGLLPFNITPANIGFVRSNGYRNDLLVKTLREFPSPPNLDQNEGVKAMRSEMKSQNLYPPIFWTYPNLKDAICVILLNESAPSEWEKVSDFLLKNKYIANIEARHVTGVIDKDAMSKMLKRWVGQGLLIKIEPPSGSRKNVKYRLPNPTENLDLFAKPSASKN